MDKFVPYEKLSKSKKREMDKKKRTTWQMSPVTRKPDNPKAYKRKKTLSRDDWYSSAESVFYYSIKVFILPV